jgi:hypothetical protein
MLRKKKNFNLIKLVFLLHGGKEINVYQEIILFLF